MKKKQQKTKEKPKKNKKEIKNYCEVLFAEFKESSLFSRYQEMNHQKW